MKSQQARLKAQNLKRLEKVLNKFANNKTGVPDYRGFSAWLAAQEEATFQSSTSTISDAPSKLQRRQLALVEALFEAYRRYEKKLRRGQGKTSMSDRNIRKAKLLLHWYDNLTERAKRLLHFSEDSQSDLSFSEIRKRNDLNPLEIQYQMRRAITSGHERDAFILFGKLSETEHDEGELDYFESLLCFESGDYDGAIEKSRAVDSSSIDYSQAALLQLTAHAKLGNIKEFFSTLSSLPSDLKITGALYMRLTLILMESSGCAEEVSDRETEMGSKLSSMLATTRDSGQTENSPETKALILHCCRRAVVLVEKLQQFILTECNGLKGQSLFEEFEKSLPPNDHLPLIIIFSTLPKFFEIFELSPHDMYKPIVETIFGTMNTDLPSALVSLEVLYRLADKTTFIRNSIAATTFFSNIEDDPKYWSKNLKELANFAYIAHQEALVIEDSPLIEDTKKVISSLPDYEQRIFGIHKEARSESLKSKLSGNGKQLLEAAEGVISSMRAHNGRWDDAGLATMGFVRTLEYELCFQIINPLLRAISIDHIRPLIEALTNKKDRNFWDSILTLKLKQKSLTLAPARIFLNKINSDKGSDADIKKYLKEVLRPLLNQQGWEKFLEGRLAELISEDHIDQRNDAAHGRFVSLDSAEQARGQVLHALRDISLWVKDAA